MRWTIATAVTAGILMAQGAEPAATATITVDVTNELGRIKPMHAVNNGPTVKKAGGDQKCGNFEDYKAACIPFARTHDSINCVSGGAHTCDINAVFPDFDADENDPKNYDFVFTDHYLDNIHRAGTEIFFRLGQSIEHGPKKYGVLPPKDFGKWARICEHVIRHYNEGWGWGLDTAATTRNIVWSNQFNIVYWEIWNEPDLDDGEGWKTNPRTWGGSREEFFRLYETAAKHLKGRFPHLKIGGPALCYRQDWAEAFLAHCQTNAVPLDFFSWHTYARTPEPFGELTDTFRAMLDRHGFTETESILNEWNYIKGWGDDFVYSLRTESGDLNLKGAAFIASVMVTCQSKPLGMLMFYDARVSTSMNNMFDRTTLWPRKGYYPFYAWSKLVECGTQLACSVTEGTEADSDARTGFVEKKDRSAPGGFRAVAAKGAKGRMAVFVTRYSDDDNVSDIGTVKIRIPRTKVSDVRCCLTDLVRTQTDVRLETADDGALVVRMMPWSFALVEFKGDEVKCR